MEGTMGVSSVLLCVFCLVSVSKCQEQCNGELWCEQGHCCGSDSTHCCTYYYELWWFWMIWGLIIMLSCCCLYQQHRLKKRQRRALRALQTGLRDGSFVGLPVINTDGQIATTRSTNEPYTESELRLPTYDEVRDLPKDPPAYEVLFEARRDDTDPVAPSVPKIVSPEESGRSLLPPHVTDYSAQGIADGDEVGLLDNEAVPEEDPPPAYTVAT